MTLRILGAMLLALLCGSARLHAQYVVNGSATQLSCNCYRLTQALNNQSGSVWNENMISLTDSFDFTFDVYLGSNDFGADGIAFVLQPISTSIGAAGGGLGYDGVSPSLAVEIDTYQNPSDPPFDHLAIMGNGIVQHNNPAGNLAGPVPALYANANIEDGVEHRLRVFWDPLTQVMQVYLDDSLRLEYQADIVQNLFSGDPLVYWGFTGSTGGLNNEQRFCLSIIPGLAVTDQQICAGQSVLVIDSSYSALGSIVQWQWDFGNGQTSTAENPGAITYSQPGQYHIVQSIVDAAGCSATDSTLLTVLPNPVAAFTVDDVCLGDASVFSDQSVAPVGNITSWQWELGAYAATADVQNPIHVYPQTGDFEVTLTVTTGDGCTAQVAQSTSVNPLPISQLNQGSEGLNAQFVAWPGQGESVQWVFGDTVVTDAAFQLTFPDSGWYSVTLITTTSTGCTDTLVHAFYLTGRPEFNVGNVFTPNGDAVNDRFEPYTYAVTEANCRIFNRWGRPVFTYEGPVTPGTPWGWDGSVNGAADAASGTYYFLLDMVGANGTRFTERGTVTLLR